MQVTGGLPVYCLQLSLAILRLFKAGGHSKGFRISHAVQQAAGSGGGLVTQEALVQSLQQSFGMLVGASGGVTTTGRGAKAAGKVGGRGKAKLQRGTRAVQSSAEFLASLIAAAMQQHGAGVCAGNSLMWPAASAVSRRTSPFAYHSKYIGSPNQASRHTMLHEIQSIHPWRPRSAPSLLPSPPPPPPPLAHLPTSRPLHPHLVLHPALMLLPSRIRSPRPHMTPHMMDTGPPVAP